jgi:hypothetical protein
MVAAATGVPARTVSRILRRAGEPRLADCDPLTGQLIRASKATTVRYERDRSGELVHLDVKKNSAVSPTAAAGAPPAAGLPAALAGSGRGVHLGSRPMRRMSPR